MNEAQAAAQQHAETKYPIFYGAMMINHDESRRRAVRDFIAGHAAALSWTPIKPGEVPELPRDKKWDNRSVCVPLLEQNGCEWYGYYNYKRKKWFSSDLGCELQPTHYFTGFIGNLPGNY